MVRRQILPISALKYSLRLLIYLLFDSFIVLSYFKNFTLLRFLAKCQSVHLITSLPKSWAQWTVAAWQTPRPELTAWNATGGLWASLHIRCFMATLPSRTKRSSQRTRTSWISRFYLNIFLAQNITSFALSKCFFLFRQCSSFHLTTKVSKCQILP